MSGGQKWTMRVTCFLMISSASGAGMYFAYTQGLEDGVLLEPPLIVAETTPIKVLPSEPGGRLVPHQDKLVYQQLLEEIPEAPQPIIASAAEKPLEQPRPVSLMDVEDLPNVIEGGSLQPDFNRVFEPQTVNKISQPQNLAQLESNVTVPPVEALKALDTSIEGLKNMGAKDQAFAERNSPTDLFNNKSFPDFNSTTTPNPHPREKSSSQHETSHNVASDGQETKLTVQLFETQQDAKKRNPIGASGSGPYYAQLGSFKRRSDAEGEWTRLSQKYADLVAGLAHRFHVADLGDRGIYQRILVGGFASKTEARNICAAMVARKERCLVNRIDE